MASKGINDQNPPDCDEFNVVFFKKAWQSIRGKFTNIVLYYVIKIIAKVITSRI